MVSTCREVRLAAGTRGGGTGSRPVSAAQQQAAAADSALRTIVKQQRRQQRLLFSQVTERLRRNSADLQRLSQLRQTAEPRHPAPWSPELVGLERLLTDEETWREYERRYLFTGPVVQLPPPREVGIALLTARITGAQEMLPAPGSTCSQGFFPPAGRSRLAHNEPRQRVLLPGARLPNTVIIRLLWSTRTLLDVEHYREMENRRTRRRQHWEFFEWSDLEEEEQPPETVDRLESVATRRRNRDKVVMTDHEHLENWFHIAENGTDVNAATDSEDDMIARARQRGFSCRGQLLSVVDLGLDTEGDAFTQPLGGFRWEARSERNKQNGEMLRGERRDRDRDRAEGSLSEDALSSSFKYSRENNENLEHDSKTMRRQYDPKEHVRGRAAESDQEGITSRQKNGKQITGRRSETSYTLLETLTADGRATMPDPGLAPGATAQRRPSSVPPRWPSPWTAPERPSGSARRVGSVSPSPAHRGRTSTQGGGQKCRLNAARVRPDIDAEVLSAISTRSPPRRRAFKLPHLYEVKDYACEDPKLAGRDEAEKVMRYHGMKPLLCMPRDKRRIESASEEKEMPISEEVWSSSQIPGVFYDLNAISEHERNEEISDLPSETSKEDVRPYISFQPKYSPQDSTLQNADDEIALHLLAVDYIHYLMQYKWAQDLLHGIDGNTLNPWDAAERLVKRLAKQPFEIQQQILDEVQTIHRIFPAPNNLRSVSNGILASLYPAIEDIRTLSIAMDTLVLIGDQMDVVLANILSLAVEEQEVRDSIQSLLERLGLVDPRHLVLTQVLSWAPRGRRRNLDHCRREIIRRVLNFITNWSQAFEAHSKLIAEEVNKRKMDATVKYNIIKILKDYEPSTVEETSDGFNVILRGPPSICRLKNPEVIEVLNYFVEMTDELDALQPARREDVLFTGHPEAGDLLSWRRRNKDILVPPWPSPVLQGNRPLAAGVLRPTALVTHWQGVSGLAPGPWPSVTIGIHLRIADKYYRGAQPATGLPAFC